jgi:nondiscriminating glutamyl-tRNA synthetase
MRLRFAPSPTGHLHIGNVRTAIFNWLLARGHGGTFVIRIEDTDVQRSTGESEASILRDLRWLGLDWDEGPDVGGHYGPYRQSQRAGHYRDHARRLVDAGHAYYCFCTPEKLERDRQAAHRLGRAPRYPGTCRSIEPSDARARIADGAAAAVRLRVPDEGSMTFRDLVRGDVTFQLDTIGDPVLVRSDGTAAYNFAVVVDDALMAVTHVIRGEDHISNTPRQILLYRAFGYKPPQFAHLSLVLGPDHSPLSKRHGATSVAEFREKGYLPEALVNYLSLIGWSPGDGHELLPIEDLARRFSLEHVGHSAGVFDEEKLAWVNRHYLKSADPERIAKLAMPYFLREGFVAAQDDRTLAFLTSIVPIATSSVDRLDQIPGRCRLVFTYDAAGALADDSVRGEMAQHPARAVVTALAADLAHGGRLLDREAFRAAATRVRERTGQKGRGLFHPIRLALTGKADGPELDLLVPAIDRGADLSIAGIVGCRERAAQFVDLLKER